MASSVSNGAGKSTLLKILSRITEPSSGRAEIYGRVGSLLEVGTGFHQELTGRENIYLNGAILGMRKAEIDRKLDEIVAFSEVEQVPRYAGEALFERHVRAAGLCGGRPPGAGDPHRRRGPGRGRRRVSEEVSRARWAMWLGQGRTVLFVSHNMAAITRLCQWAVWLDRGTLKDFGTADEVVARYYATGTQALGELTFRDRLAEAPGSEFVRLLAARTRAAEGHVTTSIGASSPVDVEIEYEILRPASSLRVGFTLIAHDGTVVFSSNDADGQETDSLAEARSPGTYLSRCTIPGTFLNYGRYFLSFGSDTPMIQQHFSLERGLNFNVEQTGGVGGHVLDGRQGLVRPGLPWTTRSLS